MVAIAKQLQFRGRHYGLVRGDLIPEAPVARLRNHSGIKRGYLHRALRFDLRNLAEPSLLLHPEA